MMKNAKREKFSLHDHAGYIAAVQKRDALLTRQRDLNAEIEAATIALTAMRDNGDTFETLAQKEAVAKLLGEPAPFMIDKATVHRLHSESEQMSAALVEIEARVNAERVAASAEICAKLKPAHDAIVAGICDALFKLQVATDEYSNFIRELSSGSVDWRKSFRSMSPNEYGIAGVHGGRLGDRYVKSAVRWGFVDKSKLPEAFQRLVRD